MKEVQVERTTCARIPTEYGEFQLCHYRNNLDEKEHLALVLGDIGDGEDILVRMHSECFTGDTLGSLRCDCGPQLQRSMQLIAEENRGVIIYLRQEGRDIGLLDKLRAYNLQDQGYDTVEANLMLGHQADKRDYSIAALIIKDLGLRSIRLLTNNPSKIESLRNYGITVSARIPLQEGVNSENFDYLMTKAQRMRHMLDLELLTIPENRLSANRPFVTLSYAQSLDGSIAERRGHQLLISGPESLMLTHRIRADHDAILVGIGTLLADDPHLTVRLVNGDNPQPVVLDSRLRTPLSAKLLHGPRPPWIFAQPDADWKRQQELENEGARIIRIEKGIDGRIDLDSVLSYLVREGIQSLMVEGGARIITSFLAGGLVDRLVVTISPTLIGGLHAVEHNAFEGLTSFPKLLNTQVTQSGNDIVMLGDILIE